jgi:hypothetical protein
VVAAAAFVVAVPAFAALPLAAPVFAAPAFVVAVEFVFAPAAPWANAAADHTTDPNDMAVKPAIMRAHATLLVSIFAPDISTNPMEPFLPDNSSTRAARKYEVIMFHAARNSRSQATAVVSPFDFCVGPLMCHGTRHLNAFFDASECALSSWEPYQNGPRRLPNSSFAC